jgi:predicted RNase H-like HicB family nuclease
MDIQQSLTAMFEPAEEGGYIAYIVEIEGVNSQGFGDDFGREA